jgi:hypothetical protein
VGVPQPGVAEDAADVFREDSGKGGQIPASPVKRLAGLKEPAGGQGSFALLGQ